MPESRNDGASLQQTLETLREKHGVVGASLAIHHQGQVEAAAAGLLNLDTQVEATTEAVFQIGSISKVFTATLIMQLVDEGRLDIDASVKSVLPEFAIADKAAESRITVRQVLCHSSGIDGDLFAADDSWSPSASSYLQKMHLLSQLFPPGEQMSYSNSAYVVLGRIIEVLHNRSWPLAVMQRICRPLGMQQAFAEPKEALRFRCAMGHLNTGADRASSKTADETYLSISMASCGTVLSMSASDLLKFAACHMAAGESRGETALLSTDSARAMQAPQLALSPLEFREFNAMGLGWLLTDDADCPGFGHYGATLGQYAYLCCFPRQQWAFALLTNSPSQAMFAELRDWLLDRGPGLRLPPEPPAQSVAQDPNRFIGRYASIAGSIDIYERDGQLRYRNTSMLATTPATEEFLLQPHAADCFDAIGVDSGVRQRLLFFGRDAEGRAAFLRSRLRLIPRVNQ